MSAFNLPPGCSLADLEPKQVCEHCGQLREIVTFDPPFLCEECAEHIETAQNNHFPVDKQAAC